MSVLSTVREYLTDWVLVLVSGCILLFVLYFGYSDALDGKYVRPILEFGTRSQIYTHQTTRNIYKPGDTVYARILFHKTRNIKGRLQWNLINQRLVTFPARDGSLPAGVWDKEVQVETIPEDTRPGIHYFCGSVTYRPNWLGIVEYPIWSNKFEVVKK